MNSKSGTFLNECRVMASRTVAAVTHGSILKVGLSEFLLHLHRGTDSCLICQGKSSQLNVQYVEGSSYRLEAI